MTLGNMRQHEIAYRPITPKNGDGIVPRHINSAYRIIRISDIADACPVTAFNSAKKDKEGGG